MIPLTSYYFSDRGSNDIWIAPEQIVAIYCEASGATGILTVAGVVYHVKEPPDQIAAAHDLMSAAKAVVDAYDSRGDMPSAITHLEGIIRSGSGQ